MKKFLYGVFFISVFFTVELYAVVLPPGFTIRQFPKTRDDISTFKIELKVTYKGEYEFKETLWVKYPGKIRAYIQKEDEAIIFIREGKDCVAVTSGKRIVSGDLCSNPASMMFYRLFFPGYNYEGFLKSIGIELWEKDDQLSGPEHGGYVKPEGIQLVRHKDKPVLIVGIDDSTYKSKLRSARPSSNIGDSLIESLKYEDPQVWLDESTYYPTRVYGSGGLEIILKNYIKDANDIPMPSAIEILRSGQAEVTFGLTTIETKLNIDDSFLSVEAFNDKFKGTIEASSLSGGKSIILDYLSRNR